MSLKFCVGWAVVMTELGERGGNVLSDGISWSCRTLGQWDCYCSSWGYVQHSRLAVLVDDIWDVWELRGGWVRVLYLH